MVDSNNNNWTHVFENVKHLWNELPWLSSKSPHWACADYISVPIVIPVAPIAMASAESANKNNYNDEHEAGTLQDFLPTLSLAGDIKVSIIDYVVKIVGGALTFVLLAVALRRKFERKYTH